MGVWSRLAIAASTRHQPEAKEFLQWLLSGDRLLRFDMTVPGHMIPPLHSIQSQVLTSDIDYVQKHSTWIESFNGWVDNTNHPVMNMGSVTEGEFKRADTPPPWAGAVFGTPGIVSNMLNEIALGNATPEAAWERAVAEMQLAVTDWKDQHPDWQPPACGETAARFTGDDTLMVVVPMR